MNTILEACQLIALAGIWLCCQKIVEILRQKHHGPNCEACGE